MSEESAATIASDSVARQPVARQTVARQTVAPQTVALRAKQPGIVRKARRPPGFVAPGPKPPQVGSPGAGEDLCYLTGNWRLFQLQDGHRWSLDDLVTAYQATESVASKRVQRVLDLGCGLGSVLLMTAWRLRWAGQAPVHVGVEAQAQSAALCRRSARYNGVEDAVTIVQGDFRGMGDLRAIAGHGAFDLITGTPPYFHDQEGPLANHPQKVQCRFETRGTVKAYVKAGEAALVDDGTLVLCDVARKSERVYAAAAAAGLAVHAHLNVMGRVGKAPLIAVYTLRRDPCEQVAQQSLTVRDDRGQWTPDFVKVRQAMGMPWGARSNPEI